MMSWQKSCSELQVRSADDERNQFLKINVATREVWIPPFRVLWSAIQGMTRSFHVIWSFSIWWEERLWRIPLSPHAVTTIQSGPNIISKSRAALACSPLICRSRVVSGGTSSPLFFTFTQFIRQTSSPNLTFDFVWSHLPKIFSFPHRPHLLAITFVSTKCLVNLCHSQIPHTLVIPYTVPRPVKPIMSLQTYIQLHTAPRLQSLCQASLSTHRYQFQTDVFRNRGTWLIFRRRATLLYCVPLNGSNLTLTPTNLRSPPKRESFIPSQRPLPSHPSVTSSKFQHWCQQLLTSSWLRLLESRPMEVSIETLTSSAFHELSNRSLAPLHGSTFKHVMD